MPEDRTSNGKHNLNMEKRENVSMTGVLDVISFDEDMIVAETDMGILILKGENLHVNRLNLEKGDLEVEGLITNVTYEEEGSFSSPKGSLLSKIFK